jgi:hypothetical protein
MITGICLLKLHLIRLKFLVNHKNIEYVFINLLLNRYNAQWTEFL